MWRENSSGSASRLEGRTPAIPLCTRRGIRRYGDRVLVVQEGFSAMTSWDRILDRRSLHLNDQTGLIAHLRGKLIEKAPSRLVVEGRTVWVRGLRSLEHIHRDASRGVEVSLIHTCSRRHHGALRFSSNRSEPYLSGSSVFRNRPSSGGDDFPISVESRRRNP
jgi:hypothetical protein